MKQKWIFLSSFLTIIMTTLCLGQMRRTVQFNKNDFGLSHDKDYDAITGPIQYRHVKGLGEPKLPLQTMNLIIPAEKDVESITIEKKNKYTYPGNYNIEPVQPDVPNNLNEEELKKTPPKPEVYQSDNPFPKELVDIGSVSYFDGSNKIIQVNVSPFEYRPALGELSMYEEISFTLNFIGSTKKPFHVQKRSKQMQEIYDKALSGLVENTEDIGLYGNRPQQFITKSETTTAPLLKVNAPPNPPPPLNSDEYLIITTQTLRPYFQNFINYKISKGFSMSIATTDQIYYYYPNGDLISGIHDRAGSIRQFLHDAYATGTTFVLIGGDSSRVPVRMAYESSILLFDPQSSPLSSDLYYSDVTSAWVNAPDGNYHYLHFLKDFTNPPDCNLFVGRIPIETTQDILNWMNKVIQYETNPFPGNNSAALKVLWSASDEMEDNHEPGGVTYFIPLSFTKDSIKEIPTGNAQSPTAPTGAQIITQVNQGYGWYLMFHHGWYINCAVRTRGYNTGDATHPKYGLFSYDSYDGSPMNPPYVQESGNGFDNITQKSTIIYSVCCNTAGYDRAPAGQHCMADAYLKNVTGGPAFLGNTRDGLGGTSNVLEQWFFQEIFVNHNYNIGVAQALSKFDYKSEYIAYSHNLFGDPSMPVWHTTPPPGKISSDNPKKSEEYPISFELAQNYPNPFNPSTTIQYSVPQSDKVKIVIYDVLGNVIRALLDETKDRGVYTVLWDGKNDIGENVGSGLFFYRMNSGSFECTKKMTLVK